MPAFLHQPLLWGLLIVGVPVLIHLINMLRHRRVQWAAMEFLLVSQKKNRTWILFKQLLLLLLRMAVVATVVLMVAQPLLRNQFGNLFGSAKTHHIVLIDDSFSMSDRWSDKSAFGEAKGVVEQIGVAAARDRQPQTFTLLRFSRVGQRDRGTQPDLLKTPVRSDFTARLTEVLRGLDASQTAAGPSQAIAAIGQLLGDPGDERRIVYLVSDFRAREWDHPAELQKQLLRLSEAQAELHLIDCVEQARPNLAVTSLGPTEGIRAAGVPLFMEVGVKNFGTATAKNVSVSLEEDGHARPALVVAEIPPGQEVRERFQVNFATAAAHLTTARLESDAVEADNSRYDLTDFAIDVPVLLIDAAADPQDARYLDWALAPGGTVRTGIRPQIETPRYLSLHPSLDEFGAICLCNVDRLDESAVAALEKYAAAGGGVAFFLGPQCRSKFFNDELYRDGKGLFPLPLLGQETLAVDRLERAPDLQASGHPIFRRAADERYGFLQTVLVHEYFAAPQDWRPAPDSTTQVVAQLRNRAPLVVERAFGKGRVVAFLTTAAPVWNNWAKNPSFVIAAQDLLAYLAVRLSADGSYQVGANLALKFDPSQYQKQVRFRTPTEDAAPTAAIDATPTTEGSLVASLSETDNSGVYEARLTKNDGTIEARRYAVNVNPDEGNLAALSGPQLAARLDGVKFRYEQAAAFHYTLGELAGYNMGPWLLYLLVVLLAGEQILAWSASYHPPARTRRPAVAGGVP